MGQKTAPPEVKNIAETVRKYLFYMAFIRSASPDTLRSYRGDLTQAFTLTKSDCPLPDEEKGSESAKASRFKPEPMDEESLLEACRGAQNRWSTLAPASRNRKAATMKSFLNWLHQEGAIERDLATQVHAPKVPVRLPHHLSVDEALALLRAVKSDAENAPTEKDRVEAVRDGALLLLLYGGGLRVSEACGLEWRQIENNDRVLRIKGKGSKERMVALPPLVGAALKNLREARQKDDAYVFGAEPLHTRKAYDIVRSRGVKAGLFKPLHPHALRHSFATHLLSSGANLRTLQELLGHRTLQATQRYTHLGIDQLARTMESFHPLGTDADQPKKKQG